MRSLLVSLHRIFERNRIIHGRYYWRFSTFSPYSFRGWHTNTTDRLYRFQGCVDPTSAYSEDFGDHYNTRNLFHSSDILLHFQTRTSLVQDHREFPFGYSREFLGIADLQNSRREFPGISEILAGITGNFASFVFFPIFIVDYDILVFNLTDFWAKPWMTSLSQLFVFIVFRYTFKYWYRKITEQRQNFANSDRYTNEDAKIILIGHRPRFCIHRRGMEGVLRKMF